MTRVQELMCITAGIVASCQSAGGTVVTADRRWIQPAQVAGAESVWGFRDGIQVGLSPIPGPRGLIRIYAPYAGAERPRMINFISIEPVANGTRGQSELEKGLESGRNGLEFRTADSLEGTSAPRDSQHPAAGRIEKIDGHEALMFFVVPEPFRNGSRPIIQVILRKDRPFEVGLRVFAGAGSAPMTACVLSATMGNYSRLRRLWLGKEVVKPGKLWTSFKPHAYGFAPWRTWKRDRMLRQGDELIVAATPDEKDPASAAYDSRVGTGWHYRGRPATQYWRTRDAAGTVVRVNGRTTYWMSDAPIPGGIAYENFELEAPFRSGQEFRFGVTLDPPEKLGFRKMVVNGAAGG